ncbi:hypothetical protein FKM82_028861, partial [Ascaphus truei]
AVASTGRLRWIPSQLRSPGPPLRSLQVPGAALVVLCWARCSDDLEPRHLQGKLVSSSSPSCLCPCKAGSPSRRRNLGASSMCVIVENFPLAWTHSLNGNPHL